MAATATDSVMGVRDVMGIRPRYFRSDGGTVVISDRLGDLLPAEPELSEHYLARALVGDFSDQTLTPFAGVHRIPAGHRLRVDESGVTTVPWWSPPAVDRNLARADHEELAEELRRLLVAAVERCLVDDHVALEVTGGLDSSTVAALASTYSGRRLTGYTFAIDHAAIAREQPFVNALVARFPIDHHIVTTTADPDRRPAWPPPHPTRLPDHRLAAYCRAGDDGATVLLSGWGGDQVASYAATPAGLLRRGSVGAGVAALRRSARFRGVPVSAALRSELLGPVRQNRSARESLRALTEIVEPGFAQRSGLRDIPMVRAGYDADEHRRRWFTDGHLQRRMELYAWDMSRTGVRYRYPLLDRDLVEWCLRVPAHRWHDDGVHRSLFRTAIRDLVPAQIVARPRKTERDPQRAAVVRLAAERHIASLSGAVTHPLVRRYLPGLDPARVQRLDLRRRSHLAYVIEYLRSPELRHLH